jgi:hypothetical protein
MFYFYPGSIVDRVLTIPGNREIFLNRNPEREIELCLIILDELSEPLKEQENFAVNQSFKAWKQIMFIKNMETTPKATDSRHVYLRSSGQTVRNIEIAVTKHCDVKGYAVLLRMG